jgi:hypothetical protein
MNIVQVVLQLPAAEMNVVSLLTIRVISSAAHVRFTYTSSRRPRLDHARGSEPIPGSKAFLNRPLYVFHVEQVVYRPPEFE